MFVGINHDIKKPEAFWGVAEKVLPNLPEGTKLVSHCANKEGSSAFCLWEVEGLESFKAWFEPQFGGELAVNTFFEVDPEKVSNLPITTAAAK